jgi:DNA mismatch repair protein MutL
VANNNSAGKKRWIRPLPEKLINKIAAGEVIERPAAVLKELVENSLDAEATRIDVVVEKSGTKLIGVTDNGCGIEAEQVEVAFARHATSKISNFEDLDNLRSFGFRGEALPSIASVSRVRLISKTAAAENGMEIVIEGGVKQSLRPIAAPTGTRVEVENLFYNTPARRKFLKAEITEARHLTRAAIAMALSSPRTAFSYALNGRKLFSLDNADASLATRVETLLAGEKKVLLYDIAAETTDIKIFGHLSQAGDCRQNQYGLYLFVNNRHIRSQSLVHAIIAGYGETLPRGRFPFGAIFLQIDPLKVDVNVHPTKAEVRLSDEKTAHDLLYQAVKKGVRTGGGIPSALRIGDAGNKIDHFSDGETVTNKAVAPKAAVRTALNPETGLALPLSEADIILAEKKESTADWEVEPEVVFIGQFGGIYLLYKSRDRLLIVDQHAADERILYEETLKALESGRATSQNLLFPVNIELSVDRMILFEESRNLLKGAGFEAEPFGSNAVLLSAVPSVLSRKSPEKIFLEIIDDIEIIRKAGDNLKKGIAQSIACRGAIMAGDRILDEEALALYKRLMKTENSQTCPHGRPTILTVQRGELDARFGRK